MTMVRRVRFENKGVKYQKRCHFCHRPKGELYQTQFSEGGPSYLLCPGSCFKTAMTNYQEKIEKGIMPTIESPTDSGISDIQAESIEGENNITGENYD